MEEEVATERVREGPLAWRWERFEASIAARGEWRWPCNSRETERLERKGLGPSVGVSGQNQEEEETLNCKTLNHDGYH